MRVRAIDIYESVGQVLTTSVFQPSGKKLLTKGHIVCDEDIRVLQSEGVDQIWVAEIEDGETPEDEAVCAVASELGCGCYETRLGLGGRANLVAAGNCCVLVDEDLLRQINCRPGIVIATTRNFSFATHSQRVATIKSSPFAVSTPDLEGVTQLLRERGPLLQARPTQDAAVAVVYCDPISGDRARMLFEPVMRQRLERFGLRTHASLAVLEDDEHVSQALQQLWLEKPSVLLVATTTAPAGPDDAVGRAMRKMGCQIERFLAPVEPGSLLLMGYKNGVPIMSAPGCFRTLKPNMVDLLLPPMMASYRVSGWDIACLGHGGLLDDAVELGHAPRWFPS